MSNIKKSQRRPTKTEHYVDAINAIKNIMLYICENFGLVNLQHNVLLFSKNCMMSDYDKADLERLIKTYKMNVDNDYLYTLTDKFRDRIFDSCFDCLWFIVDANTVYPNSEYEANLRKNYIWQAIAKFEYILQLLQLILSMTNREKDINKINMFITDIQNVIAKLKGWKRYAVKMNKTATNNEAQRQANFEFQKNIYLKNLINEKINQGIEDYINSTEINAITLTEHQACKALCEIMYNHNPDYFNKQYIDENGNEINNLAIFFPEDCPSDKLPPYTYNYMRDLATNSLRQIANGINKF